MTDQQAELHDKADETPAPDEKKRRTAGVLALFALLLLLLCVLATVMDVWLTRGPAERQFITRNLECLKCHTEMMDAMSDNSVHDPFLKRECTVCHTPHGTETTVKTRTSAAKRWQQVRTVFQWLPLKLLLDLSDSVSGVAGVDKGGEEVVRKVVAKGDESRLVAEKTELCWICHGDLGAGLNMRHQHAPFTDGYCTNCHNPHSSKYRVLLSQDERDLCPSCHRIGPWMAKDQVHPPVFERYCTNCHDPHASEHDGVLKFAQRDLCFICHPSVAPLSLKAVQHYPFEYDNCTGCHEPHASDHQPLLIKNQPDVCYDCHTAIQLDFLKPSHHPVGTVDLTCSDCHDPHGADYRYLLTAGDNAFCYQCHAVPIQATYEVSRHQPLLCIKCHTPHGSAWTPLLRDQNPRLCLGCHTTYDEKIAHPVNTTYWDVAAREPLTCTSTCHNPHGTAHGRGMLGQPLPPRDGICLECHTEVGVWF